MICPINGEGPTIILQLAWRFLMVPKWLQFAEWVKGGELMNEWKNEWVSEGMNVVEWMNEGMNEWVNEGMDE